MPGGAVGGLGGGEVGVVSGAAGRMMTHNVIMVKALLMLTFEMGGVLGEGWGMVLEVFMRLDQHLCERGLPPNASASGKS
jgi:hypothetical protein